MRRLAIALLAAAAGLGLLAPGAARATPEPGDTVTPNPDAGTVPGTGEAARGDLAPVDLLQISGLFDEIVVDRIISAIDESAAGDAQALIIQLNSKGAVVSRDRMTELLEAVHTADIPIAVWVGSTKARAYGLPAQLLAVADVSAMAPGARIGHTGAPLPVAGAEIEFGGATEILRSGSLGLRDARSLGALKPQTTDEGVPGPVNMVYALDGLTLDGRTLETVTSTIADDGNEQLHATTTRFVNFGFVNKMLHTAASPPVAYLFFVIGLALLVFEFFTAGVGIAGVVGAVCAILGCYGLAAVPTRGWAIAMLLVAIVAFAIDVQVGVPRLWTGVGVVLFAIGSWFLFRSVPGSSLRPSWVTLVAGVGGVVLAFVVGMPSMVRTRFATPTVGREWMLGQTGEAVGDVSPDGVVLVGSGRWRARTNRATPITAGQPVRVVAIDGVTLEVEPLEGAARDYRDRARTSQAAAGKRTDPSTT